MHFHISRILALFVAAVALVSCRNGNSDESPVRRLDKEGHLYSMDYSMDYELDKVVASGATTNVEDMISYLKRELAGDDAGTEIPGMNSAGGCSSFTVFTPEGDALFCRNYDYRHDPLAVVLRTDPADGYSSIGVADAAWLDIKPHSAKSKSDFHFLVADSTGRTVVIEYIDNEMRVIDSRFVANEHLTPGIGKDPSSCPRYRMMESNIDLSRDTLSTADAMNILSLLRQGGHRRGAPTQWSAVYNLNRREMDICVGMDYSDRHHFKL